MGSILSGGVAPELRGNFATMEEIVQDLVDRGHDLPSLAWLRRRALDAGLGRCERAGLKALLAAMRHHGTSIAAFRGNAGLWH